MSADLPKLPQAAYSLDLHDGFPTVAYSAQQMYDFANAARQEAARQAMERTLSICRQMEERGYDAKDCAEAIEDAIRALIPQSEKRHG